MGLLTTYTDVNCVVDTALQVNYTRRIVFGQWVKSTITSSSASTTYTQAWEYARAAVKTYRYVGLDEATARECASAMRALYTRTSKTSVWNGTTGEFDTIVSGDILMADVVAQHDDGDAWFVTVSVHEQDTRMNLLSNINPESLFGSERSRDYDGETEGGDD